MIKKLWKWVYPPRCHWCKTIHHEWDESKMCGDCVWISEMTFDGWKND